MIKSILLFIAIFISGVVLGQSPEFNIIAPDTVPPHYNFEISYQLKNAKGTDFDYPEFDAFDLISGPNVSTQFSMINGETSQEMSYNYILKSKEPGTYTIAATTIFVEGKPFKTDWKKIVVEEGYVMPKKNNQQFDFFRDPFRDDRAPEKEFKKDIKRKKKTYRI